MKKFLALPVKAFVAVAALTLLTAAKPIPTPTPADPVYEADSCEQVAKDDAISRRNKLIPGMI